MKNLFKKKEEKKMSMLEEMDYRILPMKGETEWYTIEINYKNSWMATEDFFEKYNIPPKIKCRRVGRSIKSCEEHLKEFCENVLKWERGELENNEKSEGKLIGFFIMENL